MNVVIPIKTTTKTIANPINVLMELHALMASTVTHAFVSLDLLENIVRLKSMNVIQTLVPMAPHAMTN